MPRPTDTIAALATPAGTAALAVIRASGSDTERLAREIFGSAPPPRRLRHGDYRDRAGVVVDDVLWVRFAAPHSYTAEDALEISCHGSPYIAQRILEDLYARGCRPAAPGEFTQRAFLHGRIDLSQAEAVMDLIHARSERALAAAGRQLRGALGRRVQESTDQLVGLLAQLEAYIDFPEEDLPPEDRSRVRDGLAQLERETRRLLATGHYGGILREGIRTVILGAPNAGKSSLLNRLIGRDRALVSAEPGTTRDFLEEPIVVGPHFLRLTDTAGLSTSPGPLEKLGMDKTLERAVEADLFLVVEDATQPPPPLAPAILERLRAENTVIVRNKADLPHPASDATRTGIPVVEVSALTGFGIDALEQAITRLGDAFAPSVGEDLVTVSARHAQALQEVVAALADARAKLEKQAPAELIASDLRQALDGFGAISGRIDNERMLDKLFASFCIGK